MIRRRFMIVFAISLLLWFATVEVWAGSSWAGGFALTRYGSKDAWALRSGAPESYDRLEYGSLHDPTGRVVPFLAGPPQTIPATFARRMYIRDRSLSVPGVTIWWGTVPPTRAAFFVSSSVHGGCEQPAGGLASDGVAQATLNLLTHQLVPVLLHDLSML